MEFAQRLLGTRRGSLFLGIGAAIVAGILLLAYLSQYRDSLKGSSAPATVLVARSLVQRGTSGDVIASQQLFQSTRIAKDQLREGALVDASSLKGKVATTDIYPGQQLTATDFAIATVTTVSTKLTGVLRAISVPIDTAHGLVGQVQTGDHVDVLASWSPSNNTTGPIVKEIMHNSLVLRGPTSGGGGLSGTNATIVLRGTAREAAQFAWASDNGKIWILLRPSANAASPRVPTISSDTLLRGGPTK